MALKQESPRGDALMKGIITIAGEAVADAYGLKSESRSRLLIPSEVIVAGRAKIETRQRELPERGSLIYQGLVRAGYTDEYLKQFYFLTRADKAVRDQDGPTQWHPLSPEYRVSNDLKRDLSTEDEKKRTATAINLGIDVIKFNITRLAVPRDLPQEPYKTLMEKNLSTVFFQAIKEQAPEPEKIDDSVFEDTRRTADMFLQADPEIFIGMGSLICMVFSRSTLPAVEYRIGHRLEADTLVLLSEGPERSLLSKMRNNLGLNISPSLQGEILNKPAVVRKRKAVLDYYRGLGLRQPGQIFEAFKDSTLSEITHAPIGL